MLWEMSSSADLQDSPPNFCTTCGNSTNYEPVCGTDGQTYGNECLIDCQNIRVAYYGLCDSACYPNSPMNDKGDWNSRQPVCSMGLTWKNSAEAQYSGHPPECQTTGVCFYGVRDGEDLTYLSTSGKPRPSVEEAAANTSFPDTDNPAFDYSQALTMSLIYYDSQISGQIDNNATRLTWRGNSCLSCRGDYGEDLSMGYYESGGSTMKMSVVMSFQTAMMAWSGLEFEEGYRGTERWSELLWKVRHGAQHLMNSVVSADPPIFAAAYGNSTLDFDNYSPVEFYEQYVPPRPVGYLTLDDAGSEASGGAAAALAASALLWQKEDPAWSGEALEKAKALWVLATAKPKSYRDSSDGVIKNMQSLYASDGQYADELAWAAAWLALATQNETYAEAMAEWTKRQDQHNTLETWQYSPATNVLQASKFGESMTEHNAIHNAQQFFDRYLDGSIGRTERGAAYPYHWTAMQHVGGLAFLGQVHAKNERFVDPSYRARVFNYARFQTDYTLGSAGRSWLTGFGQDYPEYLWHKASYFSPQTWTPEDGERIWMGEDRGPWTTKARGKAKMVQRAQFAMQNSQEPQRHVAYGALFGAPLQDDGMINTRKDYTYAEPTTVTNAAITGAYAGLAEYYGLGSYDDSQLLEVMHVDYDGLILQLSQA